MKLTIEVTRDELIQAAENLIYTQNLDRDIEVDEQAISLVIKEHLEKVIEKILTDPEQYLKPNEWEQVNKCFRMSYSSYKKMMDRNIPYYK